MRLLQYPVKRETTRGSSSMFSILASLLSLALPAPSQQPAAALAFALLSPALAAETEQDYWRMVKRFVDGDRTGAITELAAWSEEDLESVHRDISEAARAGRNYPMCKGAALLHAAKENADREKALALGDSSAACPEGASRAPADRLLPLITSQPGGREFVARFSIARALHDRAILCFRGAESRATAALKRDARNPVLLLVQGLARESMGSFAEPNLRETALLQARESFEKALRVDPRLTEASLRLGRVQWRLGRSNDARRALETAMREATGLTRYMALLFLGQVLEDTRDLRGAVERYSEAVAQQPETQIGGVALAHGLTLQSDFAEARAVMARALLHAGRRPDIDPYWKYMVGSPDVAAGLLEGLRIEAATK